MKRHLVAGITAALLVIVAASPSFAGVGLRTGLSLDPDDFLIGLHFRSSPLQESLFLVPSIEAGFGDLTWIGGNLDLHYRFQTESELKPYVGGGGTLNWFDFDGGSDLEFGGSFLGGIQLTKAIFLEGKIGLGDVPDWKFVVGWNAK